MQCIVKNYTFSWEGVGGVGEFIVSYASVQLSKCVGLAEGDVCTTLLPAQNPF